MNHILIFSDNKALIKLWSTALSSCYQVNTTDKVNADTIADAIIIDSKKIDQDNSLFSILNSQTTQFLIVGENWSEDNQIKALTLGAAGYCGDAEPTSLLLLAIKSILKGDIWIQRHLVPKVIGTLIQLKSSNTEPTTDPKSAESKELLKTLSSRELEVAKMIRTGENNKAIATQLHISERTVKAHLSSIFKKLNVSDRLHLALFIKDFG